MAFRQLATTFEILGSHFVQLEVAWLLEGLANIAVEPALDGILNPTSAPELVLAWVVCGAPQELRRVRLRDGSAGFLLGGPGAGLVALYASPRAIALAWAVRGPRVRRAIAREQDELARRRAGRR